MQKFYILGSNPTLSIAEISAIAGFDKDYSNASNEVLILNDVQVNECAGVIKHGSVIHSFEGFKKDEVAGLIAASLIDASSRLKGKINFGLSQYHLSGEKNTLPIAAIGMEIKSILKDAGVSARFVSAKDPSENLSAVTIQKNKLLEAGAEFVLITRENEILLGQTDWIQDFKSWSRRDFGRPARDAKRGMLPPKLARIMVNLANHQSKIKNPKSKILIDPFCGSGTVLMEAALLGDFNQIIGSDILEKAIKDTKKNLDWLAREFKIDISNIYLFQSPAEIIDSKFPMESKFGAIDCIDIVITETFLGPPLKGSETRIEIEKNIQALKKIYAESFSAIKKILRPEGIAVVALPYFKMKNEYIFVPIIEEFKKIGFDILDPLPKTTPEDLKKYSPQGGLIYGREDARVWREIVVMVVRN